MEAKKLIEKFESFIGEGRRFKTRAEAARYFGLPASQATRFFDFLDGKDTRYMSVLDWLEKLGGWITFPDDHKEVKELSNLPASIQPDSDDQRSLLDRITHLEQKLDEKERQLAELLQYRHRWEGLMEIKKMEANVQAQAQQQKSLLFSSAPPACTGKEPEPSEPLGREVHGPPEHGDSVRE